MNIITCTDGYKTDHQSQLQKETTLMFEGFTPRKSRLEGINKVSFVGQQYYIRKYLINEFNKGFFITPEDKVVEKYLTRLNNYLPAGSKVSADKIIALHRLGYLPICIMSLPEGVSSPIKVPQAVIFNTHKDFAWLPTYLETSYSTVIWMMCTNATIAKEYNKIFTKYAEETVGDTSFVPWQGHDFSMRGMAGIEAAQMSGFAHLTAFVGTDTIPAIDFAEDWYYADASKENIGNSVFATEHAVMCSATGFYVWDKYQGDGSYQGEAELAVFKRLITETYPDGIISIVSDTWDLWKVITEYCVALKEEILARDGKVVFRPDSGDPADILCGDPSAKGTAQPAITPVQKGVVECLWDIFGGTITEKGYKLLDSHVGTIYGDSITRERAIDICERLKAKGFASINWVAGIGSFTYQFNTRDTFGFAAKGAWFEVMSSGQKCIHCNGTGAVRGEDCWGCDGTGIPTHEFADVETYDIYKDPITDDGTKKSAKGLLAVYKDEKGEYYLKDEATWEEVNNCEFKKVFENGRLLKAFTLQEVRDNVKNS